MVDPQLTSPAAEKPSEGATERRLVGATGPASSEDEPPEGADQQRGPAPLLERIRRDRQDLEAKIAKLKGYISASSEMMNKLKDIPDMKERYESLAATRADLVQNAVNLQQLLLKLKQSESRATTLAGRERALAQETTARNEAAFSELTHELTPEMLAELDPEDRANYEKKRELLKRINQSQEKLRTMEAEQQRLRMLKESVEWKLAEARANRLGLQEKAQELLHDMPGVHPAADATNWESTAAPDRSALAGLNARVAALESVPLEGLDPQSSQQLRQKLQALAEKRQQLDAMAARLAQLTNLQEDEGAPQGEPRPPTGDAGPAAAQPEQWQEQHAAAMVGQRARLHQLEQSVAQIRQTLAQAEPAQLTDEPAQQARLEQERTTRLLHQQELSLQRKQQEVEESRQQLTRLRQLMTSVEQAHASGQRLSEAVPHQLTELLASASQLNSLPPSADSEPADGAPGTDRAHDDGQSRAAEYVELLRRLQVSIDSLSSAELQKDAPPS